MDSVAIVHFSPIELYPPTQNLLNALANVNGGNKIALYTSGLKIRLGKYVAGKGIRIFRSGSAGRTNPLWRWFGYIQFYGLTLIGLSLKRPTRVLYFETLSSWPVLIYSRYINRNASIFIHYHEYTSPAEYEHGMWLNNLLHRWERSMYSTADWVSHTNLKRMELFVKDVAPSVVRNQYVLPNYPPKSWQMRPRPLTNPLKIVYVGALSLTTMYIREFTEWVIAQNGKVDFTIYGNSIPIDVVEYIEKLKTNCIRIMPSVRYDQLPAILKEYSVGVILYKGHIPNYVYNAPNKLFEYLACGLDVWYPIEMVGCEPYHYSEGIPKVISINFKSIDTSAIMESIMSNRGIIKPFEFNCENELASLVTKLSAHD